VSGDFALDLRDTGKRLVPARFEFAGHEAVRRVGRIVLAEGAIGRVTRSLEIAQKSRPHLVPLLASFLFGRSGGCDGTWTDNTEKRIFDGIVDAQAAKGDATRLAIIYQPRLQL
jgi:hypothetical protein